MNKVTPVDNVGGRSSVVVGPSMGARRSGRFPAGTTSVMEKGEKEQN